MPNRWWCDVVQEMRESLKTLRFDVFPGLIEELQTMGNRMEAGLSDQHKLENLKDEIHDLKREKKKLKKEIKELENKKDDLED
jgi:uncharacterized coiled-coil DUF342 family protein